MCRARDARVATESLRGDWGARGEHHTLWLPGEKQLQRVEKYKQNVSLLTIAWRNRASYMGAVRVLCNSAVAHGWIATTWIGKRVGLRGAAKYVKWLMEGANTHLSAPMPCRLLGIVVKLVRREQIAWKASQWSRRCARC